MNTRPITDKIKGALFNSWQLQIVDSKFLDLFAGSGSMGIEALSRGAEKVIFVERPQSYGYYQKESCSLQVYKRL